MGVEAKWSGFFRALDAADKAVEFGKQLVENAAKDFDFFRQQLKVMSLS
jgi:hypothetical protein